jgi:sugar fermentation stimulation protein A
VPQGHGVEGVFLQRHNRFEVECLVKGIPLRAHLPNPGKLLELLLPGAPLLLIPRQEGKLPYRVLAVAREGSWVMVDTLRTNALAAYLLRNNLVPGLEGSEMLQAEYSLGNSRFDFLLRKEGAPFFLEVKSCTLFQRQLVMFPDAETSRGRKHVEELTALAGRDTVAVFFLSFNPGMRAFFSRTTTRTTSFPWRFWRHGMFSTSRRLE